jgi:hypothetical protein
MTATMRKVALSAATVESLELDILCNVDPTGDPPEFALTDIGSYATGSTSFVAGAWAATWTAGQWLTARTGTLGSSMPIATGDRKWLWVKVAAGAETAVWLCGTVVVL